MPATYANEPTSNWTHSHALAEGDELHDTQHDDGPFAVETVHGDGSVTLRNVDSDETDTFSEREINGALVDGNLETAEGESHELATY